ncbi:hypothetical protein [Streptomyces sp. NPDC059009]|uniref:hypothetical protein n=1 Tax=Streptomyces sp. NPDC059009 TaxID=3346694 RepID=UPI0036A28869
MQAIARLDSWSRQGGHGEALELLGQVDHDWVTAKKTYVGRPGRPMRTLAAFREAYVNAVLGAILASYEGASMSAVGSQNETSDYDVTLFGGKQTWSAMKEFNDTFRSVWGKESGVVFDTNIYVDATVPPTMRHSPDSWLMKDGPPGASKEWQYVQEAASLAKMRRFMERGEWEDHVAEVADGVMSGAPGAPRGAGSRFARTTHARGAFRVADALYDSYVRSVARNLAAAGFSAPPIESDDDFVRSMEHHEENAVMRSRNILYALFIRGAQHTERSFLKHGVSGGDQGPWRSKASISELNSRALLCAMEAYHSAGAVFDVVFRQQAGLLAPSDLVFSDYVQSFNEQVGDALKDLRHYADDPGTAFCQSAKYVRRMTIAADALLQHCEGSLPADAAGLLGAFRTLSDKNGVLLRLRGGADPAFAGFTDRQKSSAASERTREVLGTDALPEFKDKLLQLARAVHVLRYSQTGESTAAAGASPMA